MKKLSDQEAKDLIAQSKNLVVIDFWATWCPSCQVLLPKLEELQKENETVDIVKIDVDSDPLLAQEHGVRGIPTLLFYKDGKLLDTLVGNQPKDKLQELLDKYSKDQEKLSLEEDF